MTADSATHQPVTETTKPTPLPRERRVPSPEIRGDTMPLTWHPIADLNGHTVLLAETTDGLIRVAPDPNWENRIKPGHALYGTSAFVNLSVKRGGQFEHVWEAKFIDDRVKILVPDPTQIPHEPSPDDLLACGQIALDAAVARAKQFAELAYHPPGESPTAKPTAKPKVEALFVEYATVREATDCANNLLAEGWAFDGPPVHTVDTAGESAILQRYVRRT